MHSAACRAAGCADGGWAHWTVACLGSPTAQCSAARHAARLALVCGLLCTLCGGSLLAESQTTRTSHAQASLAKGMAAKHDVALGGQSSKTQQASSPWGPAKARPDDRPTETAGRPNRLWQRKRQDSTPCTHLRARTHTHTQAAPLPASQLAIPRRARSLARPLVPPRFPPSTCSEARAVPAPAWHPGVPAGRTAEEGCSRSSGCGARCAGGR